MPTAATGPKPLAMEPIHTWENAIPFAGKIVACKSDSFYYQGSKPFSIPESIGLQFAYVNDQGWGDENKRYCLSRVLTPEGTPMGCPLWDEPLQQHPLKMRLATDAEMVAIAKAVLSKQAQFEYGALLLGRIEAILRKCLPPLNHDV